MRTFSQFITEAQGEVLYHVTHTSLVPKLQKEGLKTGQKANWVKAASGRKYGKGEVHAFEDNHDAIRWAARMDWETNRQTGSGKISILTINRGTHKWVVDTNDPLSQLGSRGKWLKTKENVNPADITHVEPLTVDMVKKLIQQ